MICEKQGGPYSHSLVQAIRVNDEELDIIMRGSRVGDRVLVEVVAVLPKEYLYRCTDTLSELAFEDVKHISIAFRTNGIVVTCRDMSLRTEDNTVDGGELMKISQRCYEIIKRFLSETVLCEKAQYESEEE